MSKQEIKKYIELMEGCHADQPQGNMSVTCTHQIETGNKTMTVAASGDYVAMLNDLLNLSGMEQDRSMMAVEEYANEPNQDIMGMSVDTVTDGGTDLHRSKRQYADRPRLGDNPMTESHRKLQERWEAEKSGVKEGEPERELDPPEYRPDEEDPHAYDKWKQDEIDRKWLDEKSGVKEGYDQRQKINEFSFEDIKDFYVTYKVITEWGIPLTVMATIVAGLGIGAAVSLIKQGKDALIKKYREIKGTVDPDDIKDAARKIKDSKDKIDEGYDQRQKINEFSFEDIKDFYVTYKVITEWGIPLTVMATIVAGLGIGAAVSLIKQGKDALIKKYREIKGTVDPDDIKDAARKIKDSKDKIDEGYDQRQKINEFSFEDIKDFYVTYKVITEWGIPLTVMATIVAGLGIGAAVSLIKQGKDALIKKYREIKGTVDPDDIKDAARKIKDSKDKIDEGYDQSLGETYRQGSKSRKKRSSS
jgi:hypothetical protein